MCRLNIIAILIYYQNKYQASVKFKYKQPIFSIIKLISYLSSKLSQFTDKWLAPTCLPLHLNLLKHIV